MDQQKFLGLLDMLDGGGAGRSGQTFEGGPLSGFMNALGIRPMGYQERMEAARPMPRPMMGGSSSSPTAPTPAPNPYAPGAITTTTLPPMGQMSDEALMKMIYEAMMRAQSGQRR
jgi:hypothetical protein